MSIHWYAHHLGDYAKNTQQLSLLQHGAYRILLDYYYTNEGPIPSDPKILYRICRCMNQHDRSAVDYVLSKYFVPQLGCWYHGRCDEEIEKSKNISEIRKDAANKRYANAEQKHTQPTTYNHNKYINGFERKNGTSSGAHVEGFIPSSSDQKRARLAGFKKTGRWLDEWGDKPLDISGNAR